MLAKQATLYHSVKRAIQQPVFHTMKQSITHSICKEIAKRSATIARNLTGWSKWVLAGVAAIAGALAWFTQSGNATGDDISPCVLPDTQAPAP